jgi:hypothetical protein
MRVLLCLLFPVWLLIEAVHAPIALASDGWCDTDPILVIRTPAGRLVPVYVTVGAQSLLLTPNTLLGSLVLDYTAVPTSDGKATQVTAVVKVPASLLTGSFATRSIVSSGALATGKLYARVSGVSGTPTTLVFELPSP